MNQEKPQVKYQAKKREEGGVLSMLKLLAWLESYTSNKAGMKFNSNQYKIVAQPPFNS